MTLLERGTALFDRLTKAADGRTITYQRGPLSVSLTGTPSFRRHPVENVDGFGLSVTTYDWLLTRAEIEIRGEVIEPRSGDRITDGDFVYEVMPLDDGTPCFEPVDASSVLVRVHTKRVS